MKKAFLGVALAASVMSLALAQIVTSDKVPASVKQALEVRFPDVKSVEWKIKDKDFEAEFTLKGIETTAKFDSAGKWLESEKAIPSSQVPKAVLDALAGKFRGYKIVETQTLQSYNDPRLVYEIHLESDKEILKILLHADGAIINQSVKPRK
jgi:predicted secreted protein